MIDSKRLKNAMVLFGDTQESLAQSLGLSRASLNYKINNARPFTVGEVNAIRKRYDLSLEAVASIFFND